MLIFQAFHVDQNNKVNDIKRDVKAKKPEDSADIIKDLKAQLKWVLIHYYIFTS